MYVAHAFWPSANGKIYESIYLRESYREGKRVHKRNIANLTHCDPQEIAAIELALRFKGDLAALGSLDQIQLSQGPSVGAVSGRALAGHGGGGGRSAVEHREMLQIWKGSNL